MDHVEHLFKEAMAHSAEKHGNNEHIETNCDTCMEFVVQICEESGLDPANITMRNVSKGVLAYKQRRGNIAPVLISDSAWD